MTNSSRLQSRSLAVLHLDGTSTRAVSLADRAWSLWIWQGLRPRSSVHPRRWANQHESTRVAFDGAIAATQTEHRAIDKSSDWGTVRDWAPKPPGWGRHGTGSPDLLLASNGRDRILLVGGPRCPPRTSSPTCKVVGSPWRNTGHFPIAGVGIGAASQNEPTKQLGRGV